MTTPTIDRRIKLDEPTKPDSNLIDLALLHSLDVSEHHRPQLQLIQGWCAFMGQQS